jgi:hypothetical protein
MVSSNKLREIRKYCAQTQRRHIYWKDAEHRANYLAERRETRELNRRLFGNVTFLRLLEQLETVDHVAVYEFMFRLRMLKGLLSSDISSGMAKEGRQKYLKAKLEVEIASRVLRRYAQDSAPADQRGALLHAARQIENATAYASDDRWLNFVWFFPFDLFGQKGDKRGFAIRYLDTLLPVDIPRRHAMISDFLKLIDINATPVLVRSTLRNGRT